MERNSEDPQGGNPAIRNMNALERARAIEGMRQAMALGHGTLAVTRRVRTALRALARPHH
jgi:hypothetical protein